MRKGLHGRGQVAWVSVRHSVRGFWSLHIYANGGDPGKNWRKGPDCTSVGHLDAERTEWEAGFPRIWFQILAAPLSRECDLGHRTASLRLSFLICEMGIRAAPPFCLEAPCPEECAQQVHADPRRWAGDTDV